MANFADQWVPNGPFPIVADTDVRGGLHIVADDTERDAVPLLRQKVGMLVYVVATNVMWRLTSTDTPPLSDTNFTIASQAAHDTGIVSGCGVTNPSTNVVEMAAGILAHRGTTYAVSATLTATGLAANGEQIAVFNTLTKTLVWKSHGSAIVTDLPVAFAAVTSSAFTKFEVISPVSALGFNAYEDVIVSVEVGLPAHFNSLHHAFLWLHAHGNLDTGPSRMKFIGNGYVEFRERTGLPGEITDVPVGGPVVITGSGTRFLRDFAAGDWIGMGGTNPGNRVWSRVNSVASDVSMTVASATAVATPTVYARAIMHGPHAETMDPSLAGLTNTFHGLELIGVTNTGNKGPEIDWGFRKSSGTTPNSDNVAVYGISDNSRRCLLSNFNFTVSAESTPGDYNACIIKGVGRENCFDSLSFEGLNFNINQGVSCHVNISNNPYPDIGSPSIKFSRCIFYNMGGASLTEKTVVRITATTTAGQVLFERCSFDSNGSYTAAQDDAGPSSDIDFLFNESDFNGVGTIALFKHRKTSDVLTKHLSLSKCRIFSGSKFGVISTADQAGDVAAVDLFDCQIINSMNYLGCRTVRASVSSGTHTLNGKGGFTLWAQFNAVIVGEPRYLIRGDNGYLGLRNDAADPGDAGSSPHIRLTNRHSTVADRYLELLFDMGDFGAGDGQQMRIKTEHGPSTTSKLHIEGRTGGTVDEFRSWMRISQSDTGEDCSVEFGDISSQLHGVQDFVVRLIDNIQNYFWVGFNNSEGLASIKFTRNLDGNNNPPGGAVLNVQQQVGNTANDADEIIRLRRIQGVDAACWFYFDGLNTSVGSGMITGTNDLSIWEETGYLAIKVAVTAANGSRQIKWIRCYDTP